MHAVGLDERHRGGDGAEQDLVGLGRGPAVLRRRNGGVGGAVAAGHVQPLEWRELPGELVRSRLEEGAPSRVDRLRRGQVLNEELLDVPEVEAFELLDVHLV